MAVSAASALNVTGTDTDADSYSTASWTPTTGKGYLVAFARLDLGAGAGTGFGISGNNITWSLVKQVGGTVTQPALGVWYGYATGAATAGAITFSPIVESSQTADGAIWGIAELTNVGPGSIVQSDNASTNTDSISVTLGAFADTDNATGAWVLSYDNAGTGGPAITEGSGFAIVTGLNAAQAAGGDGMRLAFEFRDTNDTGVDATAAAANDRMLMVAFELGHQITGIAAGSASGSGSATGTRTVLGTAAGAATGSGSATGTRTVLGTAAGAATGTGTASGTRETFGMAAGAATGAGTATGTRATTGTAAGAATGSGSATGTRETFGTAAGAATASGTATGTVSGAGATATGSATSSGTATGTRETFGTAAGAVTATGTATGTRATTGTASGGATSSGTATGTVGEVVVPEPEEERFGGTPYTRDRLDRMAWEERLERLLRDDEEVLLCAA